ncbi:MULTISPECIES: pca operon transcription factor PcaQ [Pseudomonas aeruginosa group]|uniref:Pca operon transcription factor PcaQ n=1 Tax=Pseudomonas nitroreducens TaxID=46680 RepID=A0A6G6ISS2_PSENT|nr:MULTISPECIES: pca operon transcription factor PcaQ [Pseudomonas aeruginosa group]KYO75126.1 HTH-type transcriptional regulator GbpR [Pseudomonas aeruginosa]QIE86017.1 pca operon transcription factor PcaQ [Pseudomonas nitroreducens]HCE6396332.1 pca operon transcription factor PcaQ [Pseudomonas aeruginosa]
MNIDNRIKFRHLVCFLEVARQRSFAKAAGLVAVSQPAISKTISELEEIVGSRLFERSKAGVTLTQAGDTFLRYAGPCVQALRDGVNTLRDHDPRGGLLRIGALSTVESLLLPDAVLRLQRRHAAVCVSVVTGSSAHLLAQLKVGDLDVVVGRMTDSPEIHGLVFEHLYSEAMTLVVRPDHPLLRDARSDPARLADYPLVLPLAGTTIRKYADSFFVQWGIPLTAQRLETLSPALSHRYVASSEAIWVAPRDAVRLDIRAGELVELNLGIQEPGGSVGICTNVALPLPLAGQWFCDALREVAGEFAAGDS